MKELRKFAKEKNIEISETQISQMKQYCSALTEKNKVMNLTAITDPDEMEVLHLIDSLEAVPLIRKSYEGSFRLIDVGCGAGMPGIPLKIIFPEAEFTLIDSLNKRITFVTDTAKEIGLKGISCVAARAEELARGNLRESFDICVSRAVAQTNVLVEYCLPFVKIGGLCILYKSGDYVTELSEAENAIKTLGGETKEMINFELPNNKGARSLLVIKKTEGTPEKYPRRPGKPGKSPIK